VVMGRSGVMGVWFGFGLELGALVMGLL
jgi:hypothetical protein